MLQIDARSATPIYEQIVENMKENVLMGYLKTGDALPSIRKLALESGINPNTIGKAYQELERQGIIETVRGRGTFVANVQNAEPDRQRLEKARKNLRQVVIELRCLGLTFDGVTDEVERICAELGGVVTTNTSARGDGGNGDA